MLCSVLGNVLKVLLAFVTQAQCQELATIANNRLINRALNLSGLRTRLHRTFLDGAVLGKGQLQDEPLPDAEVYARKLASCCRVAQLLPTTPYRRKVCDQCLSGQSASLRRLCASNQCPAFLNDVEAEPETQERAAGALTDLADRNKKDQDLIREERGIQHLENVLHKGDQQAYKPAAAALRNVGYPGYFQPNDSH